MERACAMARSRFRASTLGSGQVRRLNCCLELQFRSCVATRRFHRRSRDHESKNKPLRIADFSHLHRDYESSTKKFPSHLGIVELVLSIATISLPPTNYLTILREVK